MNFDQSGLPPIQLVQDAFNHSLAYMMALEAEEMRNFEKQVARAHRQNLAMVAQKKRQDKVSDAEYQQMLKQVEAIRQQNMQRGPILIREGLKKAFEDTHLSYARELFTSAEAASPESLAAALLVGTVRSPRDYQELATQFGPVVAGLVADLMHAKAYPVNAAETIAAANDDVKRVQMAIAISELDDISNQADEVAKEGGDMRAAFPDGYEKNVFAMGDAAWRTDQKLDTRLISAFNRAAEKVRSKFRFDRSAGGDLIMVEQKPPAPPNKPPVTNLPVVRPKPPNNNGGIGKDVW